MAFRPSPPTSLPPSGAAGGDLTGTYPNPTVSGTATIAPAAVAPVGLTGSVQASRYVGATASGAPAAGAHAVGDWVIDRTGQIWICVTAGTPGTWVQTTKSNYELRMAATGMITETFPLLAATAVTALVSQTVYGELFGLHAGTSVKGVVMANNLAASGSTPTTVRVGLADSTGTILVLSNNLNATANWPAGFMGFPFTAPYTILADGGYYACIVSNGTFGTNVPTPYRGSGGTSANLTAFNGGAIPTFSWAGQTDLPAIGAGLTISTPITLAYWMGLYA